MTVAASAKAKECGRVGMQPFVGPHRRDLAEELAIATRVAERPPSPVDADHGPVVEQYLVERDGGNVTGSESEHTEAPEMTEGP